MSSTHREVMQQAETVLRGCLEHPDAADAIAALQAALAEPQSGIKQVVELYDSPEHEPAAVKAAWLAGYTEGQKDAWAAPQPKAEQEPYCYTSALKGEKT
jgi:tryptophan 2,3-dioxygenase